MVDELFALANGCEFSALVELWDHLKKRFFIRLEEHLMEDVLKLELSLWYEIPFLRK